MKQLIEYQCDTCHRTYDTENEALACELSDVIIYPTWVWYIPLFGYFFTIYYSFFKQKHIIMCHTIAERTWIFINPILIGILTMIASIILQLNKI